MFSQNNEEGIILVRETIIIDIGHGENTYNDTGSKGVPGLEEHHFNAAVGIYMKKLLEEKGFTVYFTQDPHKRDVPLSTRVARANAIYSKLSPEEKKNCIFFSIHADANGDPNQRGHWCFYYGPGKPNEGKRLATLVTEEMNKLTRTKQVGEGIRGCYPNISWPSFYVVLNTTMTAVLHEHAFMTNKEDLILLKSDDFRQKCAEANVRAISRYLDVPVSSQGTITKEEPFMLEKAIVVNAFGDSFAAEPLAKRLKCPIFFRDTAEQTQVAKTIYVCGGSKEGLKGTKFVELTGSDRWEAAKAIGDYTKKV
jgi:N-acetylmuramoyl-L-alanine amidase